MMGLFRNDQKLEVKVLLNTGLFEKPESDLKDLLDLKTSGKEAFLLASYSGQAYYFYSDWILIPPSEGDILSLPPIPLKCFKKDHFDLRLEERYPTISGYELLKKDEETFKKLLFEEKYIMFREFPTYGHVSDRTRRIYIKRFVNDIFSQVNEAVKRGIDPWNILLILGKFNPRSEGFVMPYIAGVEFRKRGYIFSENCVENPGCDYFAIRLENAKKGAFLIGLIFGIEELEEGDLTASCCIVEDEAQYRILENEHGLSQALRYLYDSAHFGKAFVTAPLAADYQIKTVKEAGVGIVTFDEDGKVIFIDCEERGSYDKQLELTREMGDYISLAKDCFKFALNKLSISLDLL
ncbi:MAG: hypothetical protein QXO16_01355 [Archaeoglobaceae archaeon]